MAQSTSTAAVVHDLDSLPLPPMPPKILESYKRRWREPDLFDDLEVGEEGLWIAMHGGEIVASGPELGEVLRMVEGYGPEEILMVYLPPDDVIELF
jgi:hypothetical protein